MSSAAPAASSAPGAPAPSPAPIHFTEDELDALVIARAVFFPVAGPPQELFDLDDIASWEPRFLAMFTVYHGDTPVSQLPLNAYLATMNVRVRGPALLGGSAAVQGRMSMRISTTAPQSISAALHMLPPNVIFLYADQAAPTHNHSAQ